MLFFSSEVIIETYLSCINRNAAPEILNISHRSDVLEVTCVTGILWDPYLHHIGMFWQILCLKSHRRIRSRNLKCVCLLEVAQWPWGCHWDIFWCIPCASNIVASSVETSRHLALESDHVVNLVASRALCLTGFLDEVADFTRVLQWWQTRAGLTCSVPTVSSA